ncbi:diaminopimelate epimerase (plasmid) [Streptomyces griseofuscus]|uniref:Diaminopimelate epimerase n=1 Tax=Streptomyces griseofuscus TaxID=146922 RepID=A0A7H1QDI7_9ACTN|nr:diaminopimelate epimerase [Streptomyces griseofuscus]QNT98367.1 diaminopimelate epimerase [Streptomyces griseofuscus]
MTTTARTATVPFAKGHGCENTFLVLLDPHGRIHLTAETVSHLTDPLTGAAADGILRAVRCTAAPEAAAMAHRAHWFMDYRNADGSRGAMCGNGIRVLARYLVDTGLCPPGALAIATRAGLRQIRVPDRSDSLQGPVAVAMGTPVFPGPDHITVTAADGKTRPATHVDMGNPHAVVFLDDPADAGTLHTGPAVEPASAYPDGVTTEFATVLSPHHLAVRVHERGVGETRACGTGACAAVAAHRRHTGQSGAADYRVDFPGGILRLSVTADGAMTLTGPAAITALGSIRLPRDVTAERDPTPEKGRTVFVR